MSDVLHVIDHDSEPDVLRAVAVREGDRVLRRRLGEAAQVWRTRLELRRSPPMVAVAWGERALQAVRGAGARMCVYRPSGWVDREPVWDLSRLVIVAHSRTQQRRILAGVCIPQPVPPPRGTADREARGIGRDDFLWLVSADTGPGGGLKPAVWAGALMHIMEKVQQPHRVLVAGDSAAHRRAVWFADQLGLEGLVIWEPEGDYVGWAKEADGAIFVPEGAGSPWSAAVARSAGLPVVCNDSAEIHEALDGYPGLVQASESKPRLVVRAMMEAARKPRSKAPEPAFFPAEASKAWEDLLRSL